MRNKKQFQFKKFTVTHAGSTMKVGTDTVLLGAWTDVRDAHQILDIGTGNGTIALMLAQRTGENTVIDAVEIEETDVLQADENFSRSPWHSKIHLYHTAVQKFFPEKKYDLIVTNPPYFSNSQHPPDEKRERARHTTTLPHDELINAVLRLLKEHGKFNIVLPFTEGSQFIGLASQWHLYCTRQHGFKSRKEKPIARWLLEFQKNQRITETGEIVLYKGAEDWSDDYINLTREFYLKI
jgi:tRNA1Val (adenine37-N6)-methyltransferase